jgi:hypothetical protein
LNPEPFAFQLDAANLPDKQSFETELSDEQDPKRQTPDTICPAVLPNIQRDPKNIP